MLVSPFKEPTFLSSTTPTKVICSMAHVFHVLQLKMARGPVSNIYEGNEPQEGNETGHRKWQGLWQLKKMIPA